MDEPTNMQRARWALAAMRAFAEHTGQADQLSPEGFTRGLIASEPEEVGEVLQDLLTNLRHLADHAMLDYDALNARAESHYQAEVTR